ncbi:serpin B11-like [Paroedura picta]|uniref:serpin B11-like n=1 Tax=Paroedura picta TaxID=143630 RepID=UPI004056EC49
MDKLAEANTAFGVDVFKTLIKEKPKENVFFSPFSITAALGMVLLGARGKTAEQMKKVLHFNKITGSGDTADSPAEGPPCDKLHDYVKMLLEAMNQHSKKYTLSIANRLYGAKQYEFHQQFLRCTKEVYGAELERVDFELALEESIKKINSWVEGQTNGKIKDLLHPDSVDPSAALVLVNAIYFKGMWSKKFEKTDTEEKPFWINANQSKNVQMMYQEHEFNWTTIRNPYIKVLELSYDQQELSMIILLPGTKGAVDQVVKDLTYTALQQWTSSSNMQKQRIRVSLPKFKLETKYELRITLESLGMRDVFINEKADLSGMSKSQLLVSKVIHQAYVEVNEEGTEAAGSTGVVIGPPVASTDIPILPEFTVDHPFLFCIRHNKTQTILFCGKFASPEFPGA